MQLLNNNIDFEYNRYALLALLQRSNQFFNHRKLQPVMKNLQINYDKILALKLALQNIDTHKKKVPIKLDLKKGWIYSMDENSNNKSIDEVKQVIDFSYPKLKKVLFKGKSLQENYSSGMQIFPVGIEPAFTKEGYLLLRNNSKQLVYAFKYEMHLFTPSNSITANFKTTVIDVFQVRSGIENTYHNIKYTLTKNNKSALPFPATYVVESKILLPTYATFLPLAKGVLMNYLFGSKY